MALRKILISKLIANIVFSAATVGVAHTQAPAVQSGYPPVNGLKMYYEIHGSVRSAGQPLILIYGGLGSSAMFSDIMPQLSKDRQVIAVDLQAHGRTADIDRPLSFESMADDVAALVLHLKIEKVDVMGYSVGGEVALRVAIQHPDLIRRLVVVSATFRRDGRYPEIVAGMTKMGPASAAAMKQPPMYELYARTALRPEDWPVVNTKLGDLFRHDYDWLNEVAAIKVPTLLVFGDADAVRTSHAQQFFELFGGGKRDGGWDGSGMSDVRLSILPGRDTSHHFCLASSGLNGHNISGCSGAAPELKIIGI